MFLGLFDVLPWTAVLECAFNGGVYVPNCSLNDFPWLFPLTLQWADVTAMLWVGISGHQPPLPPGFCCPPVTIPPLFLDTITLPSPRPPLKPPPTSLHITGLRLTGGGVIFTNIQSCLVLVSFSWPFKFVFISHMSFFV